MLSKVLAITLDKCYTILKSHNVKRKVTVSHSEVGYGTDRNRVQNGSKVAMKRRKIRLRSKLEGSRPREVEFKKSQ